MLQRTRVAPGPHGQSAHWLSDQFLAYTMEIQFCSTLTDWGPFIFRKVSETREKETEETQILALGRKAGSQTPTTCKLMTSESVTQQDLQKC